MVVLDLDGTVLLEERGKVFISGAVERAIELAAAERIPVVMNTLRFPLSVIRMVAAEWTAAAGSRIPAVLLNGSQNGYIERSSDGSFSFVNEASFPLDLDEIRSFVKGLIELLEQDIHDIVLFYYPLDWRKGEIIWTPRASHVEGLRQRFSGSASLVTSEDIHELGLRLQADHPCMATLLIDRPQDMLKSYQHSNPSSFFTHRGVDKAYGLRILAASLGASLEDAVGAGDTWMDVFLSAVGLAVMVGEHHLPYVGLRETARVRDPHELGAFLEELISSQHQ